MNKINNLWEVRSKEYGKALEGVLPKSLPLPVNEYLDRWMFSQIKKVVSSKKKLKILDLGCGYGRLSKKLLKCFPKVEVYGIDISRYYVDLYNGDLQPRGKAVVGDIRKLPFQDDFFDVVFMVTTLMYLTDAKDQQKAIRELLRVLKSNGHFIIVERSLWGYKLMTLGGLISNLRSSKYMEIPATSFSPNYMCNLLVGCDGKISSLSGIPFWTILIHPTILLSLISSKIGIVFLKTILFLDKTFSWFLTPSMYISYIGKKK